MKMSRRSFIKLAALTVAGLAIGEEVLEPPPPPPPSLLERLIMVEWYERAIWKIFKFDLNLKKAIHISGFVEKCVKKIKKMFA